MKKKIKLYKAIPTGCSRTIPKKDPRHARWAAQRKQYGYDDTELWNLFSSIACFVLPRLRSFKEYQAGYPGQFCSAANQEDEAVEVARWHACLDRMIAAFTLLSETDGVLWDNSPGHRETIRLGLNDFRDFFTNLWD